MNVYLARLSKGDRRGELLGIFAAERFDDLFWLIDQACDPNGVEVRALGIGGIYWGGDVPLKVPVLTDEEGEPLEAFDGLPGGATIAEEWHDGFFDVESSDAWRPLVNPG